MLAAGAVVAAVPLQAPVYVEGEAIVTFKPTVSLQSAGVALDRHTLALTEHYGWLSQHRGRQYGLVRSHGQTTAALIATLRQDASVETVDPNYVRRPCGGFTPNDPLYTRLWGLANTGQVVNGTAGTAGDDIQLLPAWTLARSTGGGEIVAVIDTGVDTGHPDLSGNMWVNPGEIPNNGIDDDGNGYVDDYYGYNFADGSANPTDSGFHGTHVAGTIAAVGNNGVGLIGVDYRAKIMALRVSSDGNTMTDAAVIQALQYAAMMKSRGMNIVAINASFGGGGFSSAQQAAIQAVGDVGIVFCAAAGNSTSDNDSILFYPASYHLPNMIVVAASDQNDALASFSNYGASTVDLAAPGVNILSALPVVQAGTTTFVQRAATRYLASELTYAGSTTGITAMVYACGLGNPADFPAAVQGNIALIQRGTLTFSNKVVNAMAAGARAAIIYNNVAGSFLGTLQSAGSWIPAVSISQEDGQALLTPVASVMTVVNGYDLDQAYEYLDGTSMATPHVAGAVAFAAMNFPTETVAQRIQRIRSSVDIVKGLQGRVATGGRLNLRRTVDEDGNGLPDWWENAYFNRLTGTDPNADPDHDGLSNAQEFIAGTDPASATSRFLATQVVGQGGAITIRWNGVAGRTYVVLCETNLTAIGWQPLYGPVYCDSNQVMEYTAPVGSTDTQRFYRITVQD